MKKIETKIKTEITIKIDNQEFVLTKEEATELFNSLKKSLNIRDVAPDENLKSWKKILDDMEKNKKQTPIPYGPITPKWPDTPITPYPKPYEIWCKHTEESPYDLNP